MGLDAELCRRIEGRCIKEKKGREGWTTLGEEAGPEGGAPSASIFLK